LGLIHPAWACADDDSRLQRQERVDQGHPSWKR
jgi:hypothetical protein